LPDATGSTPDAICFLDVPVNKTNVAFTKPVDRLVGESVEAWLAVRPPQPPFIDAKTGESVDGVKQDGRLNDNHLGRRIDS
jgi:hypothetical protein